MKTNESLLHKGMRAIVQSTLRREANEPFPTRRIPLVQENVHDSCSGTRIT